MATPNVTLRLRAYGDITMDLPRQALLETFPRSLLAQALVDDPTAEVIELDNPLVTPEVVDILQTVLTTGWWPVPQPDLGPVGDYLNIPELRLLEPYLNVFRQYRPEIDFTNLEPVMANPKLFNQLIKETIEGASPRIARYLLLKLSKRGLAPSVQYDLEGLFVYAAYVGQPEIVAALRPFIDPVTAKISDKYNVSYDQDVDDYNDVSIYNAPSNQALLYALYHGHPKVVAQLLPGSHLDDYKVRSPLALAYMSKNFETFRLAALSPAISDTEVIRLLDEKLPLLYLRVLLQRPNLDLAPIHYWDGRLYDASAEDINEPDGLLILDAYYRYPRMNPTRFFDFIVANHDNLTSKIPSELFISWLADPRLQSAPISDAFYQHLLWVWPEDVLPVFMAKFQTLDVRERLKQAYLNPKVGSPDTNKRTRVAQVFQSL